MRTSAPCDFSASRSPREPGTRSMSPNEQKITSRRAAMACARSIISSEVTHTGHPGPWTSSIPPGRNSSIPYLTMLWVWPPHTSIRTHGRRAVREIAASSLRAAAASRYSSRYFMMAAPPARPADPSLRATRRRASPPLRRCARARNPRGHQELPTPAGTVEAVTGAVEADADGGPPHDVLGQAAGEVRVVVLHGDPGQGLLFSPAGRRVVGVQVVDEMPRLDAAQFAVPRDRLLPCAQRVRMIQVAQVMAEERAAPLAEREHRFELTAERERRLAQRRGQGRRHRRVAARPPRRQRPPADEADHGVAAARVDGPVVHAEEVGDPLEPIERIAVLVRAWLGASVAARDL